MIQIANTVCAHQGYPDILLQSWKAWGIKVRPEVDEDDVDAIKRDETASPRVRSDSVTKHASYEGSDEQDASYTNVTFVVNFLAAVGLMLHHFMMCAVFAGHMAHILTYDDWAGYSFSLNTILFCVLLQHLLHQLWGSLPVTCTIMIGVVEVFFQWFIVSAIGESGTTITTISVLSLLMSHWLMMPLAVFSGFSSTHCPILTLCWWSGGVCYFGDILGRWTLDSNMFYACLHFTWRSCMSYVPISFAHVLVHVQSHPSSTS